ncbi:MAG: hypothetical protein ACLU97_11085 [Dorea sp.]|jgi:hypothetical protein
MKNIRKELLQNLYDTVINEEICGEMHESFTKLDEFITSILPGGERDGNMDPCMSLICDLEYAAFMAGANMALDFIAGKEA